MELKAAVYDSNYINGTVELTKPFFIHPIFLCLIYVLIGIWVKAGPEYSSIQICINISLLDEQFALSYVYPSNFIDLVVL